MGKVTTQIIVNPSAAAATCLLQIARNSIFNPLVWNGILQDWKLISKIRLSTELLLSNFDIFIRALSG